MKKNLKNLLDEKVELYNNIQFIYNDPISIPKKFSRKEDIEISGFLTALISWGNRAAILNSANNLMKLMGYEPFRFVTSASDKELQKLSHFVYRTFNASDLFFLLEALKKTYLNYGSLEHVFTEHYLIHQNIKSSIIGLRTHLLNTSHLKRSEKHLANPNTGSAAKRINMFLRWMVRNDGQGVDFGLWKGIPESALMIPLDVHSGRIARKLGLLKRKQNDWKAVEELTNNLKKFDPDDPVKYDYALFGMGVNKQFTEQIQ